MPLVGKGFDLFGGIAAELIADHFQLFVQTGRAEHGVGFLILHQFDKPHARGLRIAGLGQRHNIRRHQRTHIFLRQAHVLQAHDFGLVHLHAAVNLPEVFSECDLMDQLFQLAKLAICVQCLGPFLHLAQGFEVCGEPGQPMSCGLLFFNTRAGNSSVNGDCVTHNGFRCLKYLFHRGNCRAGHGQQIRKDDRSGHANVLSIMGHLIHPFVSSGRS